MSNELDKYESKVLDSDALNGMNIDISPQFYIHLAMISLTKSMMSDNIKEGFLRYRMNVEHIQAICEAGTLIQKETIDKEVEDFIKDKELDEAKEEHGIKIAQFKLKKIMGAIFSTKTDLSPLQIGAKTK